MPEAAQAKLVRAQKIFAEGEVAKDVGDFQKAADFFRQAIELNPHMPPYRLHLALCICKLVSSKEPLLAEAFYSAQVACRMKPEEIGNWIVFGEVALNCNKFPEAIAAYEKALSINASHAMVWGLLGFAYSRTSQWDEAKFALEKAVELDNELGTPHFILATIYYEKFFNPEKVAYHGEMGFSAKHPATLAVESMWNAAHGFLLIGQYTKGWGYFEARLVPNSTNIGNVLPLDRYPGKPMWNGERGRRILVQTEMGLGDAFIMARYLPMIKQIFDCDAIFECHKSMIGLIQQNYPRVKCVPYGEVDPESFDFQVPMMSLPRVFDTQKDTVPWEGPYLMADHVKLEEWRGRIKLCHNAPNVGICWFAGRNSYSADNHHTSKRKSLTYEQAKPIFEIPGINFVSLQTENYGDFPHPGIKDFSDTAAIIALMDVVVTVDTAVANLAGAMGKKVWVLDRFDHCWRYSDIPTPWYPTATCYRQPQPYTWEPVLEKIKADLLLLRGRMAA